MKSLIIKRSVVIGGRKTSVSVEDQFWNALRDIASDRQMTLSQLVTEIDLTSQNGNLSSALRLFVLGCYRDQIAAHLHSSQLIGVAGNTASMELIKFHQATITSRTNRQILPPLCIAYGRVEPWRNL